MTWILGILWGIRLFFIPEKYTIEVGSIPFVKITTRRRKIELVTHGELLFSTSSGLVSVGKDKFVLVGPHQELMRFEVERKP